MFSLTRAVFFLAVFGWAWLPSAVFGEAPKPRYKTFQDRMVQPRVADLQAPGVSQVSSVSELRDIQPNDWAYEALKSLVERYWQPVDSYQSTVISYQLSANSHHKPKSLMNRLQLAPHFPRGVGGITIGLRSPAI